MKMNVPCVLIYNPISGHGHLDSWNALFISSLLESGWRVLALTPDSQDLRNRLIDKKKFNQTNLQILDWNVLRRNVYQKIISRIKKIFIQKKDQANNDPERFYLNPLEFAQRTNKALELSNWRPEFVFNMYMDLYKTDQLSWRLFEKENKYKWAGIRFVPNELPTEAYYHIPSLFGMCFLDEDVSDRYKTILSKKVFSYLPDFTDSSLPTQTSEICREIILKAKGRKIVFLGGTIGGNKNLANWYELIKSANQDDWFFVQIGEVREFNLTVVDAAARKKFMENPPENIFIYSKYVTDEKIFNEIIKSSDVIFAVYRNFKISSNMLGKAAFFKRPIIVAKDYLMGNRVLKYGIGATVPEDSVSHMLSSINDLVQPSRQLELNEGFTKYQEDFSLCSMKDKFLKFLSELEKFKLQGNSLK